MSSESAIPSAARVFWLCGLSGAGKSTLANALAEGLRARGVPVLTIDGDVLRTGLCRGLGFSDSDRGENLRRAAEVANLGVDSGLCVVASFITPLEAHRRIVKDTLGSRAFSLIYANAPLTVCRERDVKGLYTRAKAGQISSMTGLTSAFEAPAHTDLTIETSTETVADSVAKLLRFATTLLGSEPR